MLRGSERTRELAQGAAGAAITHVRTVALGLGALALGAGFGTAIFHTSSHEPERAPVAFAAELSPPTPDHVDWDTLLLPQPGIVESPEAEPPSEDSAPPVPAPEESVPALLAVALAAVETEPTPAAEEASESEAAAPSSPTAVPTQAPPQPSPTPTAPTPTPTPAPEAAEKPNFYLPEVSSGPATDLEQRLFDATNRERQAGGMTPYVFDAGLTTIARIRAQQLADQDYFAHTDPYGYSMYVELLSLQGYRYAWAGENLAMNNYAASESPERAMITLMNSPTHRSNIMTDIFTRVGIGVVSLPDGRHIYAMIFLG